MGTVNVAFLSAGGPSGAVPVYNAIPLSTENVTSSGVSAASTGAAPRPCYVRVRTDTAVRMAFGPTPTAVATGMWLGANETFDAFVPAGTKVAVIDG